MNYLPMMRALLLSVALIVPTLHGMLEVTTSTEELSAQLRNRERHTDACSGLFRSC